MSFYEINLIVKEIVKNNPMSIKQNRPINE